jgi:hypothetical protein
MGADLEELKADERHWRLSDKVNTVELRNRVLSLVRKGATAEQVSQTLAAGDPEQGIEPVNLSPEQVGRMVKRYLDRVHETDALTLDQLRVLENERLDDLWLQLQRQLRNADGTVNLKIVDRLTRLSERRAKMNGLDAAQKHEFLFGNGLAALGIEEEHLDRARQAFVDTFANPGIKEPVIDADVVEDDDLALPPPE